MNDLIQTLLGATLGSGIVSLIFRFGLTKFVDALGRIPEQQWFDNVTSQLALMPDEHWFKYANQQLALIPGLPSQATLKVMIDSFTLSVREKNGLESKMEALAQEFRVAMRQLREDVDELRESRNP